MISFYLKFKKAATDALEAITKRLQSKYFRYHVASERLLCQLHALLDELAINFNSRIAYEPLMVSVRRLNKENDCHFTTNGQYSYARLIAATSFWVLSIRASNGVVEFFNLPAVELTTLVESELPSRSKLKLKLESWQSDSWAIDGLLVSKDEINILIRSLFKDLITRSQGDFELMPEALRLISGGQSLAGSVRSLVQEKHSLVRKIVNQQEAIQNQLARDIHDAVLGNVMLLKRSLSGGPRISDAEMLEIINEIAFHLREVCQDLSPRDLKDCGLQAMLEELCNHLSLRVGCHCVINCPNSIPEFPYEIALHIYRIAQECFNNIAKHSLASNVELNVVFQNNIFTMLIHDNGQGFEAMKGIRSRKQSGSGASIIKERAELINCVYPTSVSIDSHSGQGTTITLQISLTLPENV